MPESFLSARRCCLPCKVSKRKNSSVKLFYHLSRVTAVSAKGRKKNYTVLVINRLLWNTVRINVKKIIQIQNEIKGEMDVKIYE